MLNDFWDIQWTVALIIVISKHNNETNILYRTLLEPFRFIIIISTMFTYEKCSNARFSNPTAQIVPEVRIRAYASDSNKKRQMSVAALAIYEFNFLFEFSSAKKCRTNQRRDAPQCARCSRTRIAVVDEPREVGVTTRYS